jgi:hypothetical protein
VSQSAGRADMLSAAPLAALWRVELQLIDDALITRGQV